MMRPRMIEIGAGMSHRDFADTIVALSSGRLPSGVAVVRISGRKARFALETICRTGARPHARPMYGDAQPRRVTRSTQGWSCFSQAPQQLHRRGLRRVPSAWRQGRGRRDACGLSPACLAYAPRRSRRVHAARLSQRQARPARGRGAGRSDRRGDGGAAAACGAQFRRRLSRALYRRVAAPAGPRPRDDRGGAGFRRRSAMCRARSRAQCGATSRRCSARSATISAGYRKAEMIRDGFDVVIVGAPNAGKSSLLNALARRDVAIVIG